MFIIVTISPLEFTVTLCPSFLGIGQKKCHKNDRLMVIVRIHLKASWLLFDEPDEGHCGHYDVAILLCPFSEVQYPQTTRWQKE